jgi:membrane dipeptidase
MNSKFTPPPVIDGHNDSLSFLTKMGDEGIMHYLDGSAACQVTPSLCRRGNMCAGFFALHIPPDPNAKADGEIVFTETGYEVPLGNEVSPDFARKYARSALTTISTLESHSNGSVKVIQSIPDLVQCLKGDSLGMILHLEGAEGIDPEFKCLHEFYEKGLRSLGVVWSRPNIFGVGVPFRFPHHPDIGSGLTRLGRDLVKQCNQLGILLDVSHLNQRGFWDLAETTIKPLVATHSAVFSLCPNSRNLTDAQLDAIGESKGIIGVNFEVSALRSDGQNNPNTPIREIIRHVDYIANRIGIDHVAFGSDFDGATMSEYLPDASEFPRLVEELVIHGYGKEEIDKITHQNWVRVLGEFLPS